MKKVDEGWLSISVASSASSLGAGFPTSRAETLLGYERKRVAKCPKLSRTGGGILQEARDYLCVGEKSLWNTAVRNAAWPEPSSGSCNSPYKGV